MTLRIPGERTLPHKDQMLREIVAEEPVRHRPPLFVPLAAAASVALVAGALVAGPRLIGHDRPDDPAPVAGPSATLRATIGTGDVAVNGRPLTNAETEDLVAACVRGAGTTHPLATRYQPGEILHAMTINAPGDVRSPIQTVAFRDRTTGAVIGCDGQPTVKTLNGSTINGTTATPIRSLAIGSGESAVAMGPNGFSDDIWLGDGKRDTFVTFSWYSVGERVALVRQRVILNGHAGPWYVAEAIDGLVALRSWDHSTQVRVGDRIRIETQELDRDGNLVELPASGPRYRPATTRIDNGRVTIDQIAAAGGQTGIGEVVFSFQL